MATVTRLKAEVDNKNLQVLLPDGNVTSYYAGRFINRLSEMGYAISQTEKSAIEAFVNSGLSNGWIEDVQYFLPFIGDSVHASAGIVPLIDNIDNYKMLEFDAERDYSTLFEFDVNGKIKSLHAQSNSVQGIKTPVNYALQNRGASFICNVRFGDFSAFTYLFRGENDVEYNSTTNYVRGRFQSGTEAFRLQKTSSINLSITVIDSAIGAAKAAGVNLNMSYRSFKEEDNTFKGGAFVEYGSTKVYREPATISNEGFTTGWVDLDYGKYIVGQAFNLHYLKAFAFINPIITQSRLERLSTDIKTLVTALGR